MSADHLRAFQYRKPEQPTDDVWDHPMAYLTLYLVSNISLLAWVAG